MTAYLILVIIILCEVCADCDPTITIYSKVGGCWRCPNYAIHNITDVLRGPVAVTVNILLPV